MKFFCIAILSITFFSGCYSITETDYVVKGTNQRNLFIDTLHCELLVEIDPYAEDSARLDIRIEGYADTTGCSIEALTVHFSVCDEDGICTKALQVDSIQVSAPLSGVIFNPPLSDSVSMLALPDSLHRKIFNDSIWMNNVYTTFWFGVNDWSGPEFAELSITALLNMNGKKITVHHTYALEAKDFTSHKARTMRGKFFCLQPVPQKSSAFLSAVL